MPKPQIGDENLIINELIREYLEFNGYRHTLSVFLPETGQPAAPMDRTLIADQLKIREDSVSERVPMMYSVVGAHRDGLGFGGGGAPSSSRKGYGAGGAAGGGGEAKDHDHDRTQQGGVYGAGADAEGLVQFSN
jgi:hypothetical protein